MKAVRTWFRSVIWLALFSLIGFSFAPVAHGDSALGAPDAPVYPERTPQPTPTPRPTRQGRPGFEGLVLQENAQWNYAFWYPKGWLCRDLGATRAGIACSPTANDLDTHFSVRVQPLPSPTAGSSIAMLRADFRAGLSRLPGLHIEPEDASTADDQANPSWTYTYRGGRELRKARTSLVYDQRALYIVTTQGATVDEYEYWLSMLNYCHRTFQIGRVCIECFDTQGQ
jgi:hypothetical protein